MQGFIKIVDDKIIEELKSKGYKPINQSDNIASFAKTDKLLKLLNEKFDTGQFFIDNKLHF